MRAAGPAALRLGWLAIFKTASMQAIPLSLVVLGTAPDSFAAPVFVDNCWGPYKTPHLLAVSQMRVRTCDALAMLQLKRGLYTDCFCGPATESWLPHFAWFVQYAWVPGSDWPREAWTSSFNHVICVLQSLSVVAADGLSTVESSLAALPLTVLTSRN